jgi:hypothetical protein
MRKSNALVAAVLLLGALLVGAAERSSKLRVYFQAVTGHPGGWSCHVIDHRWPLCAGGHDEIANLQWQEEDAAKVKDADERKLCRMQMKAADFAAKWHVPIPEDYISWVWKHNTTKATPTPAPHLATVTH